ncbi:hypothetical protein [Achromobacter insuavis]|uniref:hypothetical protein n=1 Tax=Achromobacter insuavis TaxID=1287735 RepID=UPI001F145EC0|nr:hypothetical protein [Achromobacter insuavis]
MGSVQRDALQGFRVRVRWGQATPGGQYIGGTGTFGDYTTLNEGTQTVVTDGVHGTPRISYETRPANVSYHPRIHV